MRMKISSVARWLWQAPQHLLAEGVLLYLKVVQEPVILQRGGVVTIRYSSTISSRYTYSFTGFTLGEYLFYTYSPDNRVGEAYAEDLLWNHEYGHTLQSRRLGPLYLPLVALPSLASIAIELYLFKKKGFHASAPWERSAESLAAKFSIRPLQVK